MGNYRQKGWIYPYFGEHDWENRVATGLPFSFSGTLDGDDIMS